MSAQLSGDSDPMVVMGKIASAHGIRGWIKIQPYTECLDSLLDYQSWWIGPEHGPWREVKVEYGEAHHKVLVAQLPGCPDRNAAEKLKGMLIAVPRSRLPEQGEDEYYWSDLIGMAVQNESGEHLGKVDSILETGASQVLSVKGESGGILIPFVTSAIRQVDLKNKAILVDWSADSLR